MHIVYTKKDRVGWYEAVDTHIAIELCIIHVLIMAVSTTDM